MLKVETLEGPSLGPSVILLMYLYLPLENNFGQKVITQTINRIISKSSMSIREEETNGTTSYSMKVSCQESLTLPAALIMLTCKTFDHRSPTLKIMLRPLEVLQVIHRRTFIFRMRRLSGVC